jgi:hypothetical protein
MTKTLQFTLILLFISPLLCFSQKDSTVWRIEGPRVGIDLSRFLLPSFQNGNRHGWEVQGDIPYKGNFFPTVELGMQWFDDKESGFHYMSNGVYGRIGTDINITKFESLKDNDILFVGFRYGYSQFNQEVNQILYSNYWGSLNTSLPKRPINAHWAELVFGMKGEIFSNLFLGWSLRAKFPIIQTNDPNITPYIIPGLGKTAGETPVDFSFTLSYRFPIFRTKKLPKPIKVGGIKHPGAEQDQQQGNPGGGTQYQQGQGGLRR